MRVGVLKVSVYFLFDSVWLGVVSYRVSMDLDLDVESLMVFCWFVLRCHLALHCIDMYIFSSNFVVDPYEQVTVDWTSRTSFMPYNLD